LLSKTLYISGQAVTSILIADSFATRLRGMLFRRPLPPALLIKPTNAVHGIGMTQRLDVAFLDDRGTVLKTALLSPFGFTACRGATSAIEAPCGSFAKWDLAVGTVASIR